MRREHEDERRRGREASGRLKERSPVFFTSISEN